MYQDNAKYSELQVVVQKYGIIIQFMVKRF
jgi:hypothetical protein